MKIRQIILNQTLRESALFARADRSAEEIEGWYRVETVRSRKMKVKQAQPGGLISDRRGVRKSRSENFDSIA
jgi:hypothetical protein